MRTFIVCHSIDCIWKSSNLYLQIHLHKTFRKHLPFNIFLPHLYHKIYFNYFSLFFNWLFCLYFKFYPLSLFPSTKPIPSSLSLPLWGCYLSPHSCHSTLAFSYPRSSSLHREKGAPISVMPDKSILFNISSWWHVSPMCTLWLVV